MDSCLNQCLKMNNMQLTFCRAFLPIFAHKRRVSSASATGNIRFRKYWQIKMVKPEEDGARSTGADSVVKYVRLCSANAAFIVEHRLVKRCKTRKIDETCRCLSVRELLHSLLSLFSRTLLLSFASFLSPVAHMRCAHGRHIYSTPSLSLLFVTLIHTDGNF